MSTTAKEKKLFTLQVFPRDEKEYQAVQKSLLNKNILFTSSMGGEKLNSKSTEESLLEAEYCSKTGMKRFRLKKGDVVAINNGDKTRLQCLKESLKQINRDLAKQEKSTAKSE